MNAKFFSLVAVLSVLSFPFAQAAAPDVSKLAAANNAFAFKLLRQLAAEQPKDTIFISPYSAATVLQMAANGAAGQTKGEMQQVLETGGIPAQSLNEMSQAATKLLNSGDKNVILTTANALWYRQGVAVKPAFLAVNRSFFSSTIKPLDFGDVPVAESTINRWAREQTRGRIDGIANGMIDPTYTDMVLANAIYFKGKWQDAFDAKLTKDRMYHQATGETKNVSMMEKSKKFMYRKGSSYQAVRLPYAGEKLAMYIYLPANGSSVTSLLRVMDGGTMVSGFNEREGLVVLPKFKLENMIELKEPLIGLGMKRAFQADADFSGMFNDPHHISKVRQKAFVEVNEEGTEAAAVTAIGLEKLAAAPVTEPFEMIMNRPFLFTIADSRSGMILFMGLVNEL